MTPSRAAAYLRVAVLCLPIFACTAEQPSPDPTGATDQGLSQSIEGCAPLPPCKEYYDHPRGVPCSVRDSAPGTPCEAPGCLSGVCDGAGSCAALASRCVSDDLCTTSTCDTATNTCTVAAVACPGFADCGIGVCNPATGRCDVEVDHSLCDDGVACTRDLCTSSGCSNVPQNSECTDTNLCDDQTMICDRTRGCVAAPCGPRLPGCEAVPVKCDDFDACTTDSCDPATGQCRHGPVVCQDKGLACETTSCDSELGCVTTTTPECCPFEVTVNQCVLAPPPPVGTYTCSKPVQSLTMIWAGQEPVRVRAYYGALNTAPLLADIDAIDVGEKVIVSGYPGAPNDVIWEVFRAGTSQLIGVSKFHISCSDATMKDATGCGSLQGDGKNNEATLLNQWVFDGMVTAGGTLQCTSDNDPTSPTCLDAFPEPAPAECLGKVTAMTLTYSGASCAASVNQQGSKFSCAGDPRSADPVRIRVSDKSNPTDRKAKVYFDGTVALGGAFVARAIEAGLQRFGADTYAHIMSGATVLQTLKLHTSCSVPLTTGDVFGSLRLVGLATTEGRTTEPSAQVVFTYTVTNLGTTPLEGVRVFDSQFGEVPGGPIASLAGEASATLSVTRTLTAPVSTTATASADGVEVCR